MLSTLYANSMAEEMERTECRQADQSGACGRYQNRDYECLDSKNEREMMFTENWESMTIQSMASGLKWQQRHIHQRWLSLLRALVHTEAALKTSAGCSCSSWCHRHLSHRNALPPNWTFTAASYLAICLDSSHIFTCRCSPGIELKCTCSGSLEGTGLCVVWLTITFIQWTWNI